MALTNADVIVESYRNAGKKIWDNKGLLLGLSFLLYYAPVVIWQLILLGVAGFTGILEENAVFSTGNIVLLLTVYVLGLLVVIAASTLLFIAIARITCTKKKFTFAQAINESLRFFWKYIGLSCILGLIFIPLLGAFMILPIAFIMGASEGYFQWGIGLGGAAISALVLFIPVLFLGIKLYFSSWALVVDNMSIFDSIKHAWNFTKGRFWWVVLYMIIFMALYSLVSGFLFLFYIALAVVQLLLNTLMPLLGDAFVTIISSIFTAIILPATIVYLTQLYLDMKRVKG